MDLFTVPTITFGVLYGFFVIAHNRRRILHFNASRTNCPPAPGRCAVGENVSLTRIGKT
jgi:hypothetical protein